ncbi:MAG: GH25 family lysozyme [Oscillospiraceae bacterium]|jgi:lysozyme
MKSSNSGGVPLEASSGRLTMQEDTTFSKRKKKHVFWWYVLLFLLSGAAFLYWEYGAGVLASSTETVPEIRFDIPVPQISIKEDLVMEYGDYVRVGDIAEVVDGKLKNPDEYIFASELGTQTSTLEYTDIGYNVYGASVSITVVDTTPPILTAPGVIYVEVGTQEDLLSYAFCGDNCDQAPTLTVSGDYSFDTAGQYTLTFNASDFSGNTSTRDFVLIVFEPQEDQGTTTEEETVLTPFDSFRSAYSADGTSVGIDVSSWQGDIDWTAVKEAGVEFAMIRAGVQTGGIGGPLELDTKFIQNIDGAQAAGIKVGVYLYSYASSPDEAREQAQWLCEQLDGRTLDLPVAFDWEDFGSFTESGMSFLDLNMTAAAFMDEIESLGYSSMLYGSASYLSRIWKAPGRSVWVAYYTDTNDYEGDYMMWQQSCTGSVSGIAGGCDMDILYTDGSAG